ncbi:MAG: hypothetical protein IJJ99_09815 [Oscillospiraceae bacterium]|nr:hypothetical protein [Oscillospiraceae bacterium]
MSLTLTAVYLVAVALFLLLLLSLGFQPRFLTRIAGVLLLLAGVSGTLLYGYGYWSLCESVPQAVARTLFSVFCMFLGRNEISAISTVPLIAKPAVQIALYLTHLLALYCTASAVVGTIGARLIRAMNLLLLRRGDVNLIFGVSTETVDFAEKLPQKRIVMIQNGGGNAPEARILQIGGLLLSGEAERNGAPELLRRLGLRAGKRRLNVYCLDSDPSANLRFARALLASMHTRDIRPQQTALTVILPDESASGSLQATEGSYGYGSVLAFEREELLSRLMIRRFPPVDTLHFDGKARAEEDFEVLIVGFGRTGQAALRALVMNGQFCGSRFRATVVARDYERQAGSFFSRYPTLREQYDIEFVDADARSVALYEHIQQSGASLKYVALCTGDEKTTAEIAVELAGLFRRLGIHAPILQCVGGRIRKNADPCGKAETVSVFAPDILCGDSLDAAAMALNHTYHKNEDSSARDQWTDCDYFSRMSCRASADFGHALLRAASAEGNAEPELPQETLENLAQTEHLRWCAFHYAMGYRQMPEEIWQARAKEYLKQKQTGQTPLRIGKDTEHRLHACLTDWETLDALSEKENAVTGGTVDYRQLDRDNVQVLLTLAGAKGADRDA